MADFRWQENTVISARNKKRFLMKVLVWVHLMDQYGQKCPKMLVKVQEVDLYEHYFKVNVFVFPLYVPRMTRASWSMATFTLFGALTAIFPVTPSGTATS